MEAGGPYPFVLSDEEWRQKLDRFEYAVLRQGGTGVMEDRRLTAKSP